MWKNIRPMKILSEWFLGLDRRDTRDHQVSGTSSPCLSDLMESVPRLMFEEALNTIYAGCDDP